MTDSDTPELPARLFPDKRNGSGPGNALVALADIRTGMLAIDTSSIGGGRSGFSMLLFKSRMGEHGTWLYGLKQTIPEKDSRWAINIGTFEHGWIWFDAANGNKAHEKMRSAFLSEIPFADLEPGRPWQKIWSVQMKCLNGTDAGVEVELRATTDGLLKEVGRICEVIRDRIGRDPNEDRVYPIVTLGHDSYPHSQYGKINTPVMSIVDWVTVEGPGPEDEAKAPVPKVAPPPPPPPPHQAAAGAAEPAPRKRRVA